MSRGESPALCGTHVGRLLVLWNPILKRLLQSPLHWPWSSWFAVIDMDRTAQRTPIQHAGRLPTAWR
jgi:hypothetical protein